ncbi:hypothetical protein GWI33_016730, partial [Rhynchophorus ferrugineus]
IAAWDGAYGWRRRRPHTPNAFLQCVRVNGAPPFLPIPMLNGRKRGTSLTHKDE